MNYDDYSRAHQRCAVCHWPFSRYGRRPEIHHLIGGSGRKNPPDGSNWIKLCNRCHAAVHTKLPGYGELPPGSILTAKAEVDGSCDPRKLAALKGKKDLSYSACEIPQQFLADRARRGGDPWP